MNKLLLAALLFLAPMGAHAATCPISAGASTASIQSTLNACGSGNTATFAAGNYSITSQINLPCGVSMQGPTPTGVGTTWPFGAPTAILTSTLTNNWAFVGNACNTAATIQYLQYNGNQPSGGGGGFLHVPPGMNNLTIQYNVFYGVSALQTTTQTADEFIYMGNGSITDPTISNVLIQWNQFGFTGSGDCGGSTGLMNLYGGGNLCTSSGYNTPGTTACLYQGASDITHGGGACGGVGVFNNVTNLFIMNNSFQELEQPIKMYEAPGSSRSTYTNTIVQFNDFSGTHRIGNEGQSFNNSPTNLWDSNDFHDPIKPNAGQWALSLPAGSILNVTNNVLIANVAVTNDKNGRSGFYAGDCLEFWSGGTAAHNMCQGLWQGGINWGFGFGSWSVVNNTIQGGPMSNPSNVCSVSVANLYIVDEQCSSAPTISGNVTGATPSAITSVAPTILPTSGSVSFPLTVTLTDPGYTSGAQPQGNTGIWYTTDGSTPVPGTGTAKYLSSGSTFTLASAGTVKAVGMWGALNQPTSYPSGYGFVPSATVTNTFTGGGAPTLTGGFLSTTPINGVDTMTVGGATLQMAATGNYSDGSTGAFPSPVWTSNNTPVCTINSSTGLVTAVGPGFCSVDAQSGSIFSSSWGITVGSVGTTSGLPCKTGSKSGGLPGPGGTNPTQGIACHP